VPKMKIILCLALFAPILALPTAFNDYDPEIDMDPKQLGEYWGYTVNEYKVTTTDGYILTVYRIPQGRNNSTPAGTKRPVVFLQHGFETSSADWLINLPNQSAGFIFADGGFDVWLGNFRGTQYSLEHTTLDPSEEMFWEFSWYEMAMQDLPAMINLVLNESKTDKIYYVGHSLGTTAAFALFSQNTNYSNKTKQFHAIAPLAEMTNVQGVFKYTRAFLKDNSLMSDLLGSREFPGKLDWNKDLQQKWAKFVCDDPEHDLTCQNVLLMISGPNTRQLNASRIDIINGHSPAGTSVQTLVNFGQQINSGCFQAYDYGTPQANQEHYGRSTPPIINLHLTMPTFLYSSECDWIAQTVDVQNIAGRVGNVLSTNLVAPDFSHMDFLWGLRAASEIYDPIMSAISTDFESK